MLCHQWRKMFYTDYIITSRGEQSHANQLIHEHVGSYFIIIILSWLFWPFFFIVSLKNTVHKLSYVNREQQQMQFFKYVWRYASVSKHWFATAIYVLKYHYWNTEILMESFSIFNNQTWCDIRGQAWASIKSSIIQIKMESAF